MLLHYSVSKPKARVKLFIVDIDYPVNKNESGFIWEFVCSAHNCWAPLSNSAVCAQVKCAPQEFCQHGNVIKNKQRNRDECVGGSVASQQSSSMCCRAGTSSWSKRKTDMETSAQTHNLSTLSHAEIPANCKYAYLIAPNSFLENTSFPKLIAHLMCTFQN